MRFNGVPAWRSRNVSDHAQAKPALAGRRGATGTPSPSRSGTQAPSEPRRGQLAPPRASSVAVGRTVRSPSGVSKVRAPSAIPVRRWRGRIATP